ncbi:hypoxanthine phosphoribosyltransferase [Anaerococcus prevotii]|uniref:Hypoxanthine phosphoribosyltransferase n=1 Tax=Anaerococcus prevotii ACS-065-V-Col13 TaxID=879305 RepID=F0GUZ2_9FIRM|nr:hypoxanthine phosphoribosyltransferase [Anaerococcus prevotii]EGC82623.1 hypoxanthine phosphoribosyltransferase [Anaerococcus prevotii ACS-065-V-Col13]
MITDYSEIIDRVLIDEESLKLKIKQLAKTINDYYKDKDEVILVGILKGSVMFMAELAKNLKIDMKMDFMVVSSYAENTYSSGNVKILKDLDIDVKGKEVLIVEDIIDTGYTLRKTKENLINREAKDVKIVTLLDKPERREVEIKPDWSGFKIPNEYVVGFGLDYDQLYRNLPYIGILKRSFYEDIEDAK